MLNWMSRTALELVGQGGLGYSFDPLVEDAKNALGDVIKATLWVTFIHINVPRSNLGVQTSFVGLGELGASHSLRFQIWLSTLPETAH